MATDGEQSSSGIEAFRAELLVRASYQAIPEDLSSEQQYAALNTVIDSPKARRRALLDEKIVRDMLSELPDAGSFPEREQVL